MGAHTGQGPLPRQVLVELVLEVNEGVVPHLVICNSPQDSPDDVRPQTEDALVQDQFLRLRGWDQRVLRCLQLSLEHQQSPDNALKTQQVVPEQF